MHVVRFLSWSFAIVIIEPLFKRNNGQAGSELETWKPLVCSVKTAEACYCRLASQETDSPEVDDLLLVGWLKRWHQRGSTMLSLGSAMAPLVRSDRQM